MGAAREQVIEGLDPIMGDHDLVLDARLLERPQGEQLVVRIILDQEYDLAAHLASGRPAEGPHALPLSGTLVGRSGMALRAQDLLGVPRFRPPPPGLLSCPRCTGS